VIPLEKVAEFVDGALNGVLEVDLLEGLRSSFDEERRVKGTHCPAGDIDRPAAMCRSCGHLPCPVQNGE
jgi:hypothetical protein